MINLNLTGVYVFDVDPDQATAAGAWMLQTSWKILAGLIKGTTDVAAVNNSAGPLALYGDQGMTISSGTGDIDLNNCSLLNVGGIGVGGDVTIVGNHSVTGAIFLYVDATHGAKFKPFGDNWVMLRHRTDSSFAHWSCNICHCFGLNVSQPTIPATAASVGSAGDISWDVDYIYVCVAANTWKRSPLTTW